MEQPLVVFTILSLSSSYTPGAAFRTRITNSGIIYRRCIRVLSVTSGQRCSAKAWLVAVVPPVFTARSDSSVPRLFRLTCSTTAARTTKRSGPTAKLRSGRAAQGFRGRSVVPADSPERPPYSSTVACSFIVVLRTTCGKALWFVNPRTGREEFGYRRRELLLAQNVVLLRGYTSDATSPALVAVISYRLSRARC